jgi:DNA phosphorothioation-associated putative methyltransferase
MKLAEYQELVGQLPFGKRLPTAIYAHREALTTTLGPAHPVTQFMRQIEGRLQVGPEYNLLKFRLNEFKLSFLCYPDFLEDPHPALARALSVDLVKGKCRITEYGDQLNPPILHRKDSLIPQSHPRHREFWELTRQQEEAGLLDETANIGFRLNWERRLSDLGCRLEGHRLIRSAPTLPPPERSSTIVDRHKTALTRYDLSKPIKTLLEHGLLQQQCSVFDYGCGRGSDVAGLRALGHEVNGWDPAFHPDLPRLEANIVNLGYVLNVIEDPAERVEALTSAYQLARKLLVVSALIRETVDVETASRYQDGVLTRNRTFQKFYDQGELQQFIEDSLELTAIPAALGIFYVFRDPIDAQSFLETRTRRAIDWSQIHRRLGLPRPRRSAEERLAHLYQEHHALLDPLWTLTLNLGRPPLPEEFPDWSAVREAVGSVNRALKMLQARHGDEALAASREGRKSDLLVYLALAQLRKRVPFSHLTPRLRADMRHFFGHYQQAQEAGRELLFAAGDPDEIELACEELTLGWQDDQALYIHRSLLDTLPPILRVYAGCASSLYGLVGEADVLKLHKRSGKVSFLVYRDFLESRLPELLQRIKVNLRNRWVTVHDHRGTDQILYERERFLPPEHPGRSNMEAYSRRLRRIGVDWSDGIGPTRSRLEAHLQRLGLNISLRSKA